MEHIELPKNENYSKKEEIPFLMNREIKDFIKRRDFKEEDFFLIKTLIEIDKNILISNFHNFFQFSQNNSLKELDLKIKSLKKYQQTEEIIDTIKASDCYKTILEKYDWLTANDLNFTIEEYK